ncbi:MAG: nucleotidyltransferase domain-containing protein [Paludibacter sp.]
MILKSKHREILNNIFSQFSIPMEVWAYGSRVDGTAHDGSDLDLVVISADNKKVSSDTLKKMKEKITESNIPILVQLFDWVRLPESFHNNILKNHETLFSSFNYTLQEPETDYKKQS